GLNRARNFGKLWICRCELVLVARQQAHLAVVDKRNRAIPVELQFVKPLGVIEGFIDKRCEHGTYDSRHGPRVCAGDVGQVVVRSVGSFLSRLRASVSRWFSVLRFAFLLSCVLLLVGCGIARGHGCLLLRCSWFFLWRFVRFLLTQ